MPKKKGFVTYVDNNMDAMLGKGSVGNPSSIIIYDVILVRDLKHILLSIIQQCYKGYKITFTNSCCIIEHNENKDYSFKSLRVNNIYMLSLNDVSLTSIKCLVTMSEGPWLWHKRLTHVNFDLLNKVVSKDLVIGLPKIKISKDNICDACEMEKKTSFSF